MAGTPARLVERRRARPLLGTRVAIRVRGDRQEALDLAIDNAFADIEAVHRLMSFHARDSDVGRLNRRAFIESVRVDPRTCAVLAAAQAFSSESTGAFDITVAPRLEKNGLLPIGGGETDPAADWRDVELLEGDRVRFARRLRLDLGGIAKGYAVDRAIATLQRHGAISGLVDAGGDMRAFGPQGFRIALRHPAMGGRSGWWTMLRNSALASSVSGAVGIGMGQPIDPGRSGGDADTAWPGLCADGVAVQAPTAMTADALTKVVLFAAPAVTEILLACHRAAAVRLLPMLP